MSGVVETPGWGCLEVLVIFNSATAAKKTKLLQIINQSKNRIFHGIKI